MKTDEFDKLFKYMTERFDKSDEAVENIRVDVQKLTSLVDDFTNRQITDEDERLVMGHQLDRLNRWTHELADKIGYKLSVE